MIKTPRVLIVSPHLHLPGGVTNFVSTLIKHLSTAINYEHFPIGMRFPSNWKIIKLLFPIVDNVRLVLRYYRFGFDCVHLNPSLNSKALLRDGLFILTLNMIGFRKIIVFIHGWGMREERIIKNNHLLKFLFSWVFGKAAVILVLSSRFKKSLIDMSFAPNKVRTVTTMFDGRIFKEITNDNNHEGKAILFLSRFVREKGVYELLEAFTSIAMRFPDARLILAGEGPEQDKIRSWINRHGMSDRIKLPGYLHGEAKAQVLRGANIFVFPTYHGEGCPISLLEAMAAGLPVITTPLGGIPDIFVDGENGILIDHVSPHKIATAMERLLNDENLCSKVQENNRREAWEKYEAAIVTRRMEAIYMEVASAQ